MSSEKPDFLSKGERARLFPVLAETSKEGRATSIFLACLASVKEYADLLLTSLGRRVGSRAKVECFTEVTFKSEGGDAARRPDGLIVVRIGSRAWTALVETKIGNAVLDGEQVEAYLKLAKQNGVDAVVTVSNQFATQPSHHPVEVPAKTLGKVGLYHWSWMYLLTQADLLLTTYGVEDEDQRIILNEFRRFLTHASTGVSGFTAMPAAWSELVQVAGSGAKIQARSDLLEEVVSAWHQEMRDLALILSRQLGVAATVKLPRALTADPAARHKADKAELAENFALSAQISVPGAAAPLEVQVDLKAKSLCVSMRLRAPDDRKSSKARVNWLLRQLPEVTGDDYFLRLHWPGRGACTQETLACLREEPDRAQRERSSQAPHSLEVCLIRQIGGRFGQRKNFIVDLEATVPDFYEAVGQNLKAWQAPAPKVREGRSEPEDVSPDALAELSDPPSGDESSTPAIEQPANVIRPPYSGEGPKG